MKTYNLAFKYIIYPNETQAKELVPLKTELPFSIALQQALKNLETAYKNFFKKEQSFLNLNLKNQLESHIIQYLQVIILELKTTI